MQQDESDTITLEDYKNVEVNLHRDLMNSCRKYMNYLDIVSIIGILDVVKQEAIELEKATNRSPHEMEVENNEFSLSE